MAALQHSVCGDGRTAVVADGGGGDRGSGSDLGGSSSDSSGCGSDGSGSIFVYVPHLRTGGGELSMLELAAGFAAAGRRVWLVVHTTRTQELALPPGVQLLSLGCEGTAAALWRLVRALRAERPQWLLSAFPHSNVVALAAVAIAGFTLRSGATKPACASTRCAVTEHAPVSLQIAQHGGWRWRVLLPLLRLAYPRAAAVVAVSHGVRRDLLALAGHAERRGLTGRSGLQTVAFDPVVIANPVLPPTLAAELAQPPDHPWLLDPALQVVLSVCRLAEEKDLPTLLRAFASVHRSRPATRLLLAGEGPERAVLQALVATLGLQQVVQLPGRTGQPLRWMQRAAVLVLASRFEGFGNVLVEAMACGTPVVATDCPVGPREILQGGRLGALVPVGDTRAMAQAIALALQQRTPPPAAREAALQYTRERSCAAWLALFDRLAGAADGTRGAGGGVQRGAGGDAGGGAGGATKNGTRCGTSGSLSNGTGGHGTGGGTSTGMSAGTNTSTGDSSGTGASTVASGGTSGDTSGGTGGAHWGATRGTGSNTTGARHTGPWRVATPQGGRRC